MHQDSIDSRYGCTITRVTVAEREKSGWLLLIHQIPPKPNYFRVKIWRRLQKLGAVAIKNSVYALPSTDQAVEDLNWVLREIVEGGGDASLVEARLIEGLDDEQVKEMFRAARDADYHAIANDARGLARQLPRKGELDEDKRSELAAGLARLQKRVGEVAALDFFHARGREAVEGLLQELEDKVAARVPRMGIWHELSMDMVGNHIQVFFDGSKVIDDRDDTFKDAGKFGVWTKADSIVQFDDLVATPK